MTPELRDHINGTWREHFRLPVGIESVPGTTLFINNTWSADSSIVLWPVGTHVVVEMSPAVEAAVQALIAQVSPNRCVTIEDFKRAWGEIETSGMPMYALDEEMFRPYAVPAPYTLRQLTLDDQPAFDVFLAQCSEEDKDEGDVGLDHMIAFGVFDGERIAAAASVFIWRGFIDIGILTDPYYRGRGLAKAAVSACAAHYLPGSLVVGYRHDTINRGSEKIALALGFTYYATVDMFKKATP